jgi:hypothetical protein
LLSSGQCWSHFEQYFAVSRFARITGFQNEINDWNKVPENLILTETAAPDDDY